MCSIFLKFLRFNCESLALVHFRNASFSYHVLKLLAQWTWNVRLSVNQCIDTQLSCLGFAVLNSGTCLLFKTFYMTQTLSQTKKTTYVKLFFFFFFFFF